MWKLADRKLINAGSPGAPVIHLTFKALGGAPASWQAGDVVIVDPCNGMPDIAAFLTRMKLDGEMAVSVKGVDMPLVQALARRKLPRSLDSFGSLPAQSIVERLPLHEFREYSVGSIPRDGRMDILLRQAVGADGRLGIGSGWLGTHAPVGGELALRLRSNRDFHGPGNDRPMILIGNGTGMAGLRAHLKEREEAGHRRNWLLFGERTRQHDYHFREDIEAWLASGLLSRLDLAFSRDQAERVYVQHRLRDAAQLLQEWVADGACIYVCGSLMGMAGAVDETLVGMLGADVVNRLRTEGAYRRDVY